MVTSAENNCEDCGQNGFDKTQDPHRHNTQSKHNVNNVYCAVVYAVCIHLFSF